MNAMLPFVLALHAASGIFLAYVLALSALERWVERGRGRRDRWAPWMFARRP